MATTVRENDVEALFRRGRNDLKAERHADALAALARVVRRRPESRSARCGLAQAHYFLGEVGQAAKHLREALRKGAGLEALGPLATIAAFDPAMSHAAVLRYRRAFCAALRARSGISKPMRRARLSQRRILRIGYVSSFFHWDNWMKPVWGLIDHHDRRRFEIHLYSDSSESAPVRRHAKAAGATFHDISGLDNARAARLVAGSGIDILVDLNGYSRRERLALFLARPAPLQATWFNIFGTTGAPCFDALVGDQWVIRDEEEAWYAEPVVRLPMSYLTFEVTYPVPAVEPPPILRNGFLTFGSLASLYKLSDEVIRAWAEILRRCARSRLVLRNASLDDAGNRQHTIQRFSALGTAPDRLTLLGSAPHEDFLREYGSIDIALDTFPYNGGTTTTEAIWQGVPVLAFVGDRWISRTSASILSNAGLEEFVCRDLADYVEAAVRWGSSSRSASRLRDLRRTMRARLKASPVCQCRRFAEQMEETYRSLWQSLVRRSAGLEGGSERRAI